MTLLTVVQDVCAAVGVDRPTSVFSNINYNRTMAEMLALANEMAQRIAYDNRDWTEFYAGPFIMTGGTGTSDSPLNYEYYTLPADFLRMTLTANVWRSTSTLYPMRFIPDFEEWVRRRTWGYSDPRGEWIISRGRMYVSPKLAPAIPANPAAIPPIAAVPAVTGHFVYVDRNCVDLASGGVGDAFMTDSDILRLGDRLLKLGMIYQWKANKGSPYAEDLSTFNDTMAIAMGKDKPAPIIVGRLPISAAARVGYPFPIDPGMVPL